MFFFEFGQEGLFVKKIRFALVALLLLVPVCFTAGCKGWSRTPPSNTPFSDLEKKLHKDRAPKINSKLKYRQAFLDCREDYDKVFEWAVKNPDKDAAIHKKYEHVPNFLNASKKDYDKQRDQMVEAAGAAFKAAGLDTACAKYQVYHLQECMPHFEQIEKWGQENPDKSKEFHDAHSSSTTIENVDQDFLAMEKEVLEAGREGMELAGADSGCADILAYETVLMLRAMNAAFTNLGASMKGE